MLPVLASPPAKPVPSCGGARYAGGWVMPPVPKRPLNALPLLWPGCAAP